MQNDTKVIVGIIILTVGLLGGLVYFGNKSSGGGASEPNFSQREDIGEIVNEGDYFSGNKDAKVTIVEFSDFECPFCKILHPEISALRGLFSDEELKIVFRHMPITEIHDEAYPAAIASQAATRQGKFPEFADALYANSTNLSEEFYVQLATDLGLDIDQFNTDRQSEEVRWQAFRARDYITSLGKQIVTPTIFINGQEFTGEERSTEALAEAVRQLL